MLDLVEGILTIFVEAQHKCWSSGSDERFWGDENMTLGFDHNTSMAAFMREKRRLDGGFRKKESEYMRKYMREYNKRPERMKQKREYMREMRRRRKEERAIRDT